ncbi:MAG: thioesterase family protein [Emcibacter sp.]|nr:thioesterase family protein [Emcibacter sp.]
MPKEKKYGPIHLETVIHEDWIDYNGHLNMAYYMVIFDLALTNFLDNIGLGLDYVQQQGKSLFALENHITYQHELKLGDPVCVHIQLLDVDSKFIHYFMRLFHRDSEIISATMEQISLHVNMETRIATRFNTQGMGILENILRDHKVYERPREMGRSIAIRRHHQKPEN